MLDVLDLHDHKGVLSFSAVRHSNYLAPQTFVPSQFVQNYRRIRQVNVPQTKFHVMVSKIHRPLAFISACCFFFASAKCVPAVSAEKDRFQTQQTENFGDRLARASPNGIFQTGKGFPERS